MRTRTENDIAAGQVDRLRDAQSGLQHERQQGSIRRPCHVDRSGAAVTARSRLVQVVDRALLMAFRRHGEYALAVVQELWLVDGDILEERMDS